MHMHYRSRAVRADDQVRYGMLWTGDAGFQYIHSHNFTHSGGVKTIHDVSAGLVVYVYH